MPTWITTTEIYQQLEDMGEDNLKTVVSHCGRQQWNYPALLLAISSRESWITNILGDSGNGRGAWQIDDRYNSEYLASVIGCKPGTWDETVPDTSAYDAGYVPTLEAGLSRAIFLLQQNWQYALSAGVPKYEAARVMTSAYNCGPANAVTGWRDHNKNPDYYTTGANYQADVMQRETVVHAYLKDYGLVK